jgi:hypothetical protein
MRHVRIVIAVVFGIALLPLVALAWCVQLGLDEIERVFFASDADYWSKTPGRRWS